MVYIYKNSISHIYCFIVLSRRYISFGLYEIDHASQKSRFNRVNSQNNNLLAVTSTISNFDTCARPKKGNVAEQPGELKHKYVNNMRIGDQADDNFKQKA